MNNKINTSTILSIVAVILSAIVICITAASCQKNDRPVYNDETVYETIKIYNGSSFIYKEQNCKILDYDDRRITVQNAVTGNKSTFYGDNISLVAHEKSITTTKTKETSEIDDQTTVSSPVEESSTSSNTPSPTVSNIHIESSVANSYPATSQ